MSSKVPRTTNNPITITKACIAIDGILSARTENGLVVIKKTPLFLKSKIDGPLFEPSIF